MKIIGILVLVFVLLWLWNLGVFTYFMPKVIAKERLSKEYADIADASYALLHYIEENEEITPQTIREDDRQIEKGKLPPSRWIYADGIKRGYELKEDYKEIHRKQGQPTAYALGIEARFAKDKKIKLDENETPKEIENTIQNFIKRREDNPSLENQEIKVSTTKEKMPEEQASHYLSYRTKTFTSRYELLHHQKNTKIGYSATLFLDTWARCEEEKYILAFRGTEASDVRDIETDLILGNIYPSWVKHCLQVAYPNQVINDPPPRDEISSNQMIVTMALIEKDFHFFKNPNNEEYKALVSINPQVASLVKHREVVFEIMRKLTKKEDFKLNLVGHSLGGNLAQCFCITTKEKYISSLYTYNAPGFGGSKASIQNIFIRTLGVVKSIRLKNALDFFNPFGFIGKTIQKCISICTPSKNLEDYICYEKEIQETIKPETFDRCVSLAKQLSKGKSGIEIHHIETISQPIPLKDAFQRKKVQFKESTLSIISDLGAYKYGLPTKVEKNGDTNRITKYELTNTDKLHLLHIGGLKDFYCWGSHYMESTLQITYFYDYLLKQKDNKNKQALCGEIAEAFDYLASYTQVLIDIISCGKLLKHKRDRSYLLAYLKEIVYVLKHKQSYSKKQIEINLGDNKEKMNVNDLGEIGESNILDAFIVLDACGIYTKIIDKYDVEKMGGE